MTEHKPSIPRSEDYEPNTPWRRRLERERAMCWKSLTTGSRKSFKCWSKVRQRGDPPQWMKARAIISSNPCIEERFVRRAMSRMEHTQVGHASLDSPIQRKLSTPEHENTTNISANRTCRIINPTNHLLRSISRTEHPHSLTLFVDGRRYRDPSPGEDHTCMALPTT